MINPGTRLFWPVIVLGLLIVIILEITKERPVKLLGDPGPPTSAETVDLRARISSVNGIDELLESCPADIWQTRSSGLLQRQFDTTPWNETNCSANLEACVDDCIDGNSGRACNQVARVIQLYGARGEDMEARALACAQGNGNACTNRAASIRNAVIETDPLFGMPEAEKHLCTYRSFSIACGDDDAWGCAMLGQSYRLGEGVAADNKLAVANYQKACTLHPGPEDDRTGYAPCRFALGGIAAIEEENLAE